MGEFGAFFTESVTLERATGLDAWGDTSYASSVTILARVERDRREVLSDDEQVTTSNALLFTESEVGAGDRVTVTIDGASRTYTVQASLKHYDLEGVESHYEVVL